MPAIPSEFCVPPRGFRLGQSYLFADLAEFPITQKRHTVLVVGVGRQDQPAAALLPHLTLDFIPIKNDQCRAYARTFFFEVCRTAVLCGESEGRL